MLRNTPAISMMTRLRLSDERGIALVHDARNPARDVGHAGHRDPVLVVGADEAHTSRKADQTAYALAEAGVNNAMAVLANPTNNALNSTLLPSRTTTYEAGSVTWSGSFNPFNARWTITSVSSVRNPTGPTASPVSRRIVASGRRHPDALAAAQLLGLELHLLARHGQYL